MYARSTTIDARPDALDAGVAHVRDVLMPAARGVDACAGLSLLVDSASGCCVVTTAWRTAEAMRAAADLLREERDGLAAVLGGEADDEEWEIAVLHRAHRSRPGACVRIVRVQVAQVEHSVDLYRMVLLPRITSFTGFCSASLMVDRDSGHAVSSVTFDSREAMRCTRNLAAVVREGATREDIAEILDVAEFDLALAHLLVPELA